MSKNRYFVIIIFIVTCFALVVLMKSAVAQKSESAWKNFKGKYGGERLGIVWDKNTNLPQEISNLNVFLPDLEGKIPFSKGDVAEAVSKFIGGNREFFRIDPQDLRLARAEKIGKRWFVTFGQYYKKLPVYHIKVGAVVTDSGKIISFSSNYIPDIKVPLKPKINLEDVGKIASKTYEYRDRKGLVPKEGTLLVFPRMKKDTLGYEFHLAWKFLMQAKLPNPKIDQYFIIDAVSGEVLLKYPAFVGATLSGTVQAQIFSALPTDPLTTVPLANDSVYVTGGGRTATDASGNYTITGLSSGTHIVNSRLEGPFVKVYDYSGADFTLSQSCGTSSPCNWTWIENATTTIEETDGINVFYHLNLLHDLFYQGVLGYSWTNAWTSTPQMQARVNGSFNNAYAGNPITFGNDPFARSSDVVYHEANHNVIYYIFGDWIGFSYGSFTEGYALDEGFADYFACTFTNDSRMGEGYGGTRDLDNTIQYSLPYTHEGHYGGQIIAGAVWDLRTKFGLTANNVDNLAFLTLNTMATKPYQYYFSDPTHSNFFTSMLEADDNNSNLLDGTPHDREIFQAFRNHDLLPRDVYCRDSNADNGNIPSSVPFWTSPDIMVDAPPYYTGSGDPPHEDPELGDLNKVHIRVRNLGYLNVTQCKVKLYWANPSTGLSWPTNWNYIDEATINNLQPVDTDPDGKKVIIDWTPTGTGTGHRCLFVRVECDEDIITEEGNVKNDNNIAQKNINIVDINGAPPAEFFLNPLPKGITAERNLKIVFLDAPPEVKTVLRIPGRVKIEGRKDPDRILKKRDGCLVILPGRTWWEVTAVPADREVIVPKFSCKQTERVKLIIEAPEGTPRGTKFTLRIIEEWNGVTIGGLDYLVRL